MDFVYSFGLGFVFIMGIVFGMMVFSILRGRDKKNDKFHERLMMYWDDICSLQRQNNALRSDQNETLERISDSLDQLLGNWRPVQAKGSINDQLSQGKTIDECVQNLKRKD